MKKYIGDGRVREKKYAIANNYYFAIVNASAVSDIFMRETSIHVCVDGILYAVYEGKSEQDAEKIKQILDRHRKRNIIEHLI